MAKKFVQAKSYPGRYDDESLTIPWGPPSGKSNLSPDGKQRRYYDWQKAVVVENVGYADYYFRRMTDEERAASLVCTSTGVVYDNVWTYSEATCFVTFSPSTGRRSVTSACRLRPYQAK